MYSACGFLEPNLYKECLDRLYNETVPNVVPDYSDERIDYSDIVCFGTRNTEDFSYLEFHVIDEIYENDILEETDFFLHHDVIVAETVASAVPVKIDGNHLLAYCGFSPCVSLYESFVFNPLNPKYTLKGHTDNVNFVVNSRDNLVTASDDKSCISWDLNTLKPRDTYSFDEPVLKVQVFEDNGIAVSGEKFFRCDDRTVYLDSELEWMRTNECYVYLSDVNGRLIVYDRRKLDSSVHENKLHENSLTCFDFCSSGYVTVGLDGKFQVLNDRFEVLDAKFGENELFCVSYDAHSKFIVYGGMDDSLKYHKL